MAAEPPLLLVDGSSYLFRAFHALPDLRTREGFPTGAIRGVVGMLRKLAADFAGSPVAVVFDASGPTFRNALYADYKAHRPPMPDDLREQVQPIKDIVAALGMPLVSVQGVEADDVIGTLAAQATRAGRRTIISTGDKDMAQLVSEHVTLVNTMTGAALDRDGVVAKYGVPPERIADYLALMGDSVDNIPGVPKVGPKTAARWLAAYGSLDAVIARAGEVRGKVGENLRASLDMLPVSRSLTGIDCAVELPVGIGDLVSAPPDEAALRGFFERYEFKTWLEALSPPAAQRDIDVEVVETAARLAALLADARRAGAFALWIATGEGRSFERRPVGVALAIGGTAAYVPVAHDYVGVPQQIDWPGFLRLAGPVLEDAAIAKTGHDLKLAMRLLARDGVRLRGAANDTMLESYVLDSVGARRHHLEDVASEYLGAAVQPLEALAGRGAKRLAFSAIAVEDAARYAGARAHLAAQLHGALRPRLDATGSLAAVYDDIDRPLMAVLSRMEAAGALVDRERLRRHSVELAARMAELEEHAYNAAGQSFNLGSPKQLQEILYDKLQLPSLRKTQKGQRSTAEAVLQELAEQGHELPAIVLEHRSVAKLKSTYTDSLPAEINPATGRIHTSFNQAVAATGRLSSADPNLQNIPIRTAEGRRIRQAFVAPPGRKLLAADYSQVELRIMAHLSADAGLLQAFASGADIHRATAAEVFGEPPDHVGDDHRRSAKAINFGLIYGMSAFGLGRQLGVARNIAQGYIDRYFDRYPGVRDYMDRVRGEARANGFVETVFGRRLYLPEIRDGNAMRRQAAERAAINAPMQGTAADIIKRAMLAVDAFCRDGASDARMILQVHDELILEVPEEQAAEIAERVAALMRGAADLSVELAVDAGIGDNWDEAH